MKGDAKAFGSKNDWKRHEEGLHFQQPVAGEEWQCGEMKETVNEGVRIPCRDLFRSASKYQQHLISQHDHESDKKMLREKMVRYRAVPTDKCSYWCGFCKKRVRVTTRAPSTASIAPGVVNSDSNGDADDGIGNGNVKGPATKHKLNRDGYTLFSEFLSQRFNHIDNHFVGRGEQKMNIAQWVPDDTHRPKSNVVDEDMVLGLNRRGYHDNDMARRKRHRGEDRLSATKRSKSSGRKATAEFFAWACVRTALFLGPRPYLYASIANRFSIAVPVQGREHGRRKRHVQRLPTRHVRELRTRVRPPVDARRRQATPIDDSKWQPTIFFSTVIALIFVYLEERHIYLAGHRENETTNT